MYRAKWSIGLVLGILGAAWLVSLILANGAAAQEMGVQGFELTPSRDSGASGSANLADTEEGVEVRVRVEGLEGGTTYVHHVHEGATCEEDKVDQGGPVEFPLNEVEANDDGNADVTSVVREITLQELLADDDKERYINFHPAPPEGEAVPPGITCTTLSLDNATSILPESGGIRPATLFGAAILLVAGATLGALVLRRRNA